MKKDKKTLPVMLGGGSEGFRGNDPTHKARYRRFHVM